MKDIPAIGIDLGTTYSCVGVWQNDRVEIIANDQGNRTTPSYVSYTDEERLVGDAAKGVAASNPANTVFDAKRLMGRRFNDSLVQSDMKHWPFKVLEGAAEKPVIQVQYKGETKRFQPEEISAAVLQKMKAIAEAYLGGEVKNAVITVPAYFNDAQRNATKRAGELAGLTVERIVNEPTAAALAYGLDRLREKSKIAVFDLGGGTFDISILELNAGVFQVLATNGNTHLGGDDIDAAIVAELAARISADASITPRLREAAIAAKHTLSANDTASIELPFITDGRSFSCTFTLEELERLARPIIEQTRTHCMRALADAKVKPEQLNEVILVGGQTRMPMVRRLVAEIFGREPNTDQNPDEAVAVGATIQAGILSGAVQNVVLLDVTPLSLGIETFGGLMNIIIPRNSTIPTKRGELFTNAVAGQRSMLIRVLQGERELARDNWELGKFDLSFEPALKGHARVGVQFEIDANGILHVLARDTKTGVEQRVEMRSAVDVSDEAVEKMLGDSLEHAFEDMNDRAFTEAKLKADEMLPAVRTALAQIGSGLEPVERELIKRRAQEVETAIAGGGATALKKAVAALDEATQQLAALLVEKAMRG